MTSPSHSSQAESHPGQIPEYRAYQGGPFFEIQRRLGLLRDSSLNAGRRALIYVGLAWLVPFLLGLPTSAALDLPFGSSYLTDVGVWAKFVVAVAAFVLSEGLVEEKLRLKLRQFAVAPLVDTASVPAAAALVTRAFNKRDSNVAEGICVVLAYIASIWSFMHLSNASSTSWAVLHTEQGNSLTLAGWWTLVVSLPLFWFLMFRGLWRHLVWGGLLRSFARLRLRLVVNHPDGHGGLGFLSDYPNAYASFVFGMSCAVAATFEKQLGDAALVPKTLTIVMIVWLLVVAGLFAFSLSAFTKPLKQLKESTLLVCSALATRFQRKAEQKTIGRNIVANNADEFSGAEDPPDTLKLYESAKKLSTTLTSRAAITPLAIAALVPFAVVGFTKIPFKEVISMVKKLILL